MYLFFGAERIVISAKLKEIMYHVDKILVEPGILIEFRMEGGDELIALPC